MLKSSLRIHAIARRNYLGFGCWISEVKKHSDWIYANRAEEMNQIHKGRIYVCTDVGIDIHNCTLRMHQAFEKSNLVFAFQVKKVHHFLKHLSQKDRFVLGMESGQEQQQKMKKGTELILGQRQDNQIVSFSKEKMKELQYNVELELSKQIQMAVDMEEIMKSNNDSSLTHLKQKQQELLKFMKINTIKEELQAIKHSQGFPKVIDLKSNLSTINQLHQSGVDTACVLNQLDIESSKILFNHLQKHRLPYQILPTSNMLINLTVATGFPADRFAIEYFPQNFDDMLHKRKSMKMSISTIINKSELYSAIESLNKIYGKDHFIYLQINRDAIAFRGPASQALEYLQRTEHTEIYSKMVVSPYLSTFNEALKDQQNKESKIIGQIMAENTNIVQMEFLAKDLEKLRKKNSTKEINIEAMIIQIYQRVKDDTIVLKVLRQFIKLPEKKLIWLLESAKNKIVSDHIGLKDMLRKK